MKRIINIKRYIQDAVNVSKKILGDNLLSIVLFGSVVRNEVSKISDVDILIVVKEYNKQAEKLEQILKVLSLKYELIFVPKGFFGRLFYALSSTTGMFRPAFVTDIKSIKKWRFQRIFRVSKIMSRILAPRESVKFTIMRSYKVIYGIDPFENIKIEEPSFVEIIKSFLMNILLAICSLVLLPFHRETYKFVYEAVKWSMFNYAYVSGRRISINRLSQFFIKPIKHGIEHFITTRTNGKLSPGLLIYSIPAILKIHLTSLNELKIRKSMQIYSFSSKKYHPHIQH
ncbi:MAG: nucleotidyltransferase domain-containing protein [Candidatus Njordarchaeota archaeon]